jgi:hypothetical protein
MKITECLNVSSVSISDYAVGFAQPYTTGGYAHTLRNTRKHLTGGV